METELDRLEPTPSVQSSQQYGSCVNSNPIVINKSSVRLPKRNLPEFDGEIEGWASFYQRFTVALRDDSVGDLARFEYLLDCVKGDAYERIKGIPLLEENYQTAIMQLRRRYENKRLNLRVFLTKLLRLPSVSENEPNSLRQLINLTTSTVRALENLGFQLDMLSSELISQLIVSKLDKRTRELWEMKLSDELDNDQLDDEVTNESSSYSDLMEFLERRLRVISSVYIGDSTKKDSVSTKPTRHRAAALVATSTADSPPTAPVTASKSAAAADAAPTYQPRPCVCCDQTHPLYQCNQFKALSVPARYQKVRDAKLCVNCFSKGHWATNCKSIRCKLCHKLHHTLLHSEAPTENPIVTPSAAASGTPGTGTSIPPSTGPNGAVVTALTRRRTNGVLLATAIVTAKSAYGSCEATVLLDGASHVSFITTRLQQKLKLPTSLFSTAISGIGSAAAMSSQRTTVQLTARNAPFSISIAALVIDQITEPLPSDAFTIPSDWQVEGLHLADPRFNEPMDIDILIGADSIYDILLPEFRRQPSAPVLQSSQFGWLLAGPFLAPNAPSNVRCFKATVTSEELRAITQFLDAEGPPRDTDKRTSDERECERIFETTYTRDSTGRFVVALPRRPGLTVGESRSQAVAQLRRTRIDDQYLQFMTEYEELGHMTRCAPPTPDQEVYYLPHHAVYHNGKIRVVFNASAPSSNGLSLNDLLYVGPTIQAKLAWIITRFRTHAYAFTGDVVKLYRQLLRAIKDRNMQRIVMLIDQVIIDFQLNTVTYGEASAPYEATRCLMQLAIDGKAAFPAAAEVLERETYMDDSASGADSLEAAQRLRDDLVSLLKTAGMEFSPSKWRANHPALQLPTSETIDPELLKRGNVLGIEWNTQADTFQFSSLAEVKSPGALLTRRTALSLISKIFDPLGWLSPLTITGKLLIQELWLANVDWDDQIAPSMQLRFDEFFTKIPLLADFSIERYLATGDPTLMQYEVHGFSDASQQAYAACVYIRRCNGATVTVRLVQAKTRVAPRTTARTIPQLELCGALLLVKLLQEVTSALGYPIAQCYLYTDSTIVLAYLAKDAGHWKPFEANRVRKITAVVSADQWRHIPGEQNPADLATRDDSFSKFPECQEMWTSGPEFLHASEIPQSVQSEVRTSVSALVVRMTPAVEYVNVVPHLLHRFSECSRVLLTVMALLRVKDFLIAKSRRTAPPGGCFSVTERRRAEAVILQAVQADEFAKELQCFSVKTVLPAKSHLRSLAPILHEGLIRVGGRITHAELPFHQRHPIILPAAHRLAKLLVRDCHFFYSHSGAQFIENFLRRRYWFIGNLNALIQRCIRTCAKCTRFSRHSPQSPFMADLPETRVRPTPPFSVMGVDFAGPFTRKPDIRSRSATELKAYVAVFVCFSTKAVHLDTVADLSTPAFLACFRRFVSRRGLPQIVYSDNGTNFVGASNELNRQFDRIMRDPAIQNYALVWSIEWRFNPPAAPHMGGLWESAVRIMKQYLYRIVGAQRLVLDELSTFVAEVEAIMNSRPLVPLTSNVNPDALTPGHFLIGRPLVALPEEFVELENISSVKRWTLVTQLRNHFWRRWSEEYLRSLQKRVKWTSTAPALNVGDIVLIRDEKAAPLTWPLAKITQTHPGKDGIVRVVDLVSRNGSQLTRPVHRLVLLPTLESISTPVTPTSTAAGC
ncbi:uncharacterized protein LOC135833661 [Planococcus citri]|uniref:uncharacterized protein LOC135833661 n=1 Tax=Planococcus citri TaxID=170843 RepID=UPI0031F9AB30